MHSIAIQQHLLSKQLLLFTPRELENSLSIAKRTASYYLAKGEQDGLFIRLKRGLYGLQTHLPAEEVIANRLCRPSYLSFSTALALYGILPEMPYQITSATPLTTREYTIKNTEYKYHTIKQAAYTGYQLSTRGSAQFLVAEPEKALVDWLYFVSRHLLAPNDRLQLHQIDTQKARQYARLYGPKTTALLESYL